MEKTQMKCNNNDGNKRNGDDEICVTDSKDGNFLDFSSKKSLAERRGFNKTLIGFGTTTTSSSPSTCYQSPHFKLSDGISSTMLLESPMMLSNSNAMPSPTTGNFAMLPPLSDERHLPTSVTQEQGNVKGSISSDNAASFKFKQLQSNLDPDSLSPIFASLNQISSNSNMMSGENEDSQMFAQDQSLLDFSFLDDSQFYNDMKMIDDVIADIDNIDVPISRSEEASDESTLPKNYVHCEDNRREIVAEPEQKDMSHATGGVRTSEDGYNWRKYGQKQVKGSEYPRSYYKCTQSNCQVKKKVERSHDGHITEIIYKGNHNHAKPQSSRRASVPSNDEMSEIAEANEASDRVDADSVWGKIHSQANNANHNLDGQPDGLERTSSLSVVTEVSDPAKKSRAAGMFESDDTPEHSSALANHDGDKYGATQAALLVEDVAEDADSESRKRKNYPVETMVPSRGLREPRVVVQIESEIDILDDGYRWRKYGQKVVKGNPNPRSYYKCTSVGCTVRKHVERASHNLKFVLTTYEGKHNHDVPTARNNNHISSNDAGLPSNGANMSLTIPGSSCILKPEPHHALGPYFDRKPDFSNDFMRSTYMGSFNNDMKFGPSSMSQMKYPSLNNIIPYSAYGMPYDHGAMPQAGPIFPEFPMPLPLNLPSSGNFSLPGMNFNYAQPMSSVQSYIPGQQMKNIDTGFIRPKQELNDESLYAACPSSLDHASSSFTPPSTSSSSQSIYQNLMQNFPS